MHRRPLLDLLSRYELRFPSERTMVERIRALVIAHEDCFLRTCPPGHITGSAWIVSEDRRRFLLTHHRKLGRWLQLGGHADGQCLVQETALREAQEESGLARFEFFPPPSEGGGPPLPLDVDVHAIPARGAEPEHEHHDIRFLLIARGGQEIVRSEESHDLRWFPMEELESIVKEESLLRLGRKARAILSIAPK